MNNDATGNVLVSIKRADGTCVSSTLQAVSRMIRLTDEERCALLLGDSVTLGDDADTAITVEVVAHPATYL